MAAFPCGCCTYASDLFQRFLFERGIITLYISGQYGYGWEAKSHAWLETEDGIVVDITGDQYRNKELKFAEPVYVGEITDGFRDRFILDKPVEYMVSADPYRPNRDFNRRYDTVLKFIKS